MVAKLLQIFLAFKRPDIHYSVHKSPLVFVIHSQLDPVQNFPFDTRNLLVNIMLPSTLNLFMVALVFWVHRQNHWAQSSSLHVFCIPSPSHPRYFSHDRLVKNTNRLNLYILPVLTYLNSAFLQTKCLCVSVWLTL
jgi:hypothetical protein